MNYFTKGGIVITRSGDAAVQTYYCNIVYYCNINLALDGLITSTVSTGFMRVSHLFEVSARTVNSS